MSRQDKDMEDYAKGFSGNPTGSLAGQKGLLDRQAQDEMAKIANRKTEGCLIFILAPSFLFTLYQLFY